MLIKECRNIGYDFGGWLMGVGLLSIWVYNFKIFEYLFSFMMGKYIGFVVYVGVGIEFFELFNYMFKSNILFVGLGWGMVGVVGGWVFVVGYGMLIFKYGFGVD